MDRRKQTHYPSLPEPGAQVMEMTAVINEYSTSKLNLDAAAAAAADDDNDDGHHQAVYCCKSLCSWSL